MRAGSRVVLALTVALLGGCAALVQDTAANDAPMQPAEACLAANSTVSLGAPLRRTGARLKAGGTVKVVAIGSSSTTGVGAAGPGAAFPEAMRRELSRLRPKTRIEVVNAGRLFDTIPGNIARFGGDVLAHNPDLVVWQLGVNDIVWGGRADSAVGEQIDHGIRLLKASGADVALLDLQYAPMVLRSSEHPAMQTLIADAARRGGVGLFSRFALMRRAVDAGVPSHDLVAFDGLHNTAAGYDCIGRALARAIHAATQ